MALEQDGDPPDELGGLGGGVGTVHSSVRRHSTAVRRKAAHFDPQTIMKQLHRERQVMQRLFEKWLVDLDRMEQDTLRRVAPDGFTDPVYNHASSCGAFPCGEPDEASRSAAVRAVERACDLSAALGTATRGSVLSGETSGASPEEGGGQEALEQLRQPEPPPQAPTEEPGEPPAPAVQFQDSELLPHRIPSNPSMFTREGGGGRRMSHVSDCSDEPPVDTEATDASWWKKRRRRSSRFSVGPQDTTRTSTPSLPAVPGWLTPTHQGGIAVWSTADQAAGIGWLSAAATTAVTASHRVLRAMGVREGLGRRGSVFLEDFQSSRQEASVTSRAYNLVHKSPFVFMCYGAVFLNAVHIGVSAQISLDSSINGTPEDGAVQVLDIMFAAFFTLELLLRVLAERWRFVVGKYWGWNLLDSLLVASSLLDLAMNSTGSVNVTSARIIRLARFVRLFRMAYAIKAFTSLRVIILAIMDSSLSLYWCFMIVGFILYVFAVFFVQCVTEHFQDVGSVGSDEWSQNLTTLYGSMRLAMVTLFMTISGGIDWKDAMRPLVMISWVYEYVFLFYIFFMFFAVLNVVVGTFVATTSEIQVKDRDTQVKLQMKRFQQYANKLKDFFMEADIDRSGRLTWEEFENYLKNPNIKAYFHALELDVTQADALFKILDSDGSGDVGVSEFVEGCMWLKNQAKTLDIKLLMFQNELVFTRLNKFIQEAEEHFAHLEDKLYKMEFVGGEGKPQEEAPEAQPSPDNADLM